MKKNFTLIEMLTVTLIISIIASIAMFSYTKIRKRVYKKACIATMNSIFKCIKIFQISEPAGSKPTVKLLIDGGYLKRKPKCPSGGSYTIKEVAPEVWTVICTEHGDFLTYDANENP